MARNRFGIVRGGVYTTNRRFQKMGHLRVARLFLRTAFNFWNEKFFLRDHKYWVEAGGGSWRRWLNLRLPGNSRFLDCVRLAPHCARNDKMKGCQKRTTIAVEARSMFWVRPNRLVRR